MIPLRQIALILGGDVVGGQVVCPGPGHSPKDRSLAVRPAPTMPDGFIVHSHCGDPWQDCHEYVRARLAQVAFTPIRHSPPAVRGNKFQTTTSGALALWRDGMEPHGTLVERYLVGRKLELPDDANEIVRFHPHCPWGEERVPAMLTLFRSISGDEPTAIHRTRLRVNGDKVERVSRMMYGPVAGCAMKVSPDADVLMRLVITEGFETALSANMRGRGPSWALGSAGAIRTLPVLPHIEVLALALEPDETSRAAVRECGRRWRDAGVEVRLLEDPNGEGDLNDVLMRNRREVDD
jgi:putative DNA primase/helicase